MKKTEQQQQQQPARVQSAVRELECRELLIAKAGAVRALAHCACACLVGCDCG